MSVLFMPVCVLGGCWEVRAVRSGSSHVVCSWGCTVLPELVLRGTRTGAVVMATTLSSYET